MREKFFQLTIFICILLSFLSFFSCEPETIIKFQNQTGQELTVFKDDRLVGTLVPGGTIEIKSGVLGPVKIDAKNIKGELYFSKTYDPDELHDAKFIVTIK